MFPTTQQILVFFFPCCRIRCGKWSEREEKRQKQKMLLKKTWVPDCVEEAAVISRDDSSHKHSTVLHICSLLVLCPRSFLYLLCAPRLQKIYFEENHRLGYPTTTIPWAMQQQQQSFGLSMQQQQEQSLLFFLLLLLPLLLLLLLYPSSSFCFCFGTMNDLT